MQCSEFAVIWVTLFAIIANGLAIGFAVGMNILGIMLAGSGILNPIMAAVMHNISSAFVVINSSRLLGFDKTS